jgi:hypothetical protein
MPVPTPTPTSQAAGATLAALERYQLHVRRLVASRLDTDLYRSVSDDVEEVRRNCRKLPRLTGPWVALLIAHAELIDGLWRSAREGSTVTDAERRELLAQAIERAAGVASACMELLRAGR